MSSRTRRSGARYRDFGTKLPSSLLSDFGRSNVLVSARWSADSKETLPNRRLRDKHARTCPASWRAATSSPASGCQRKSIRRESTTPATGPVRLPAIPITRQEFAGKAVGCAQRGANRNACVGRRGIGGAVGGVKRPGFSGGSVWWFPRDLRGRPARPHVALAGRARAARRAAGVVVF